MERMWSPWRHEYVTGASQKPGCVLCDALSGKDEEKSLVVHVSERNFVVMNLFPYNAGHVMVAPARHVGSLSEATAEELSDMMGLARKLEGVLAKAYRPDGINVGMNLGRSAGAGVADHIHLHLVPRWTGDTNFMTVVADTRVIPEDPVVARNRLRELFSA
jgi:ATP adenylyltransferase